MSNHEVKDPARSSYWAGRPLVYSQHAKQQAVLRRVPLLSEVPDSALLADLDMGDSGVEVVIFKCVQQDMAFFIVLNVVQEMVITTWMAGDGEAYQKWQRGKLQIRRVRRLDDPILHRRKAHCNA